VAGSARLILVERGDDAGGEVGRAAALDQVDERVDVHALVARERGRQPGRKPGLGEPTAPPSRDGGAFGSV
jgi:hypothetical protein